MNIICKIHLKLKIEKRFLLEQKWGIRNPSDPSLIRKYILKKYLPSNAVIIDCGANNGSDSVELARVFPKCNIHSFEPIPTIFKSLKRNTRKYPNISCYQLALSDKNGVSKMFVSSGTSDASSSLLVPTGHLQDHPDVLFENSIEVKTETLDTWAAKNNIEKVDFLWLDMQGFEFKMLEASNKILPTVKAICTEVSMKETYTDVLLYTDFKKWAENKDFKVVVEAIPPGTDMGNVLFVRNNL